MKGFVPTPPAIVDGMIDKLFRGDAPTAESRVLDPGCGAGAFVDGVIRWCSRHERPLPTIIGIESNPEHVEYLRRRFANYASVEIREGDFLTACSERFDFIIGNPPYVSISALSDSERAQYRRAYATASGRFDLYLLFFEQSLRLLERHGRLVFITPEKYLYVETASPLRKLLAIAGVEELHFLAEDSFPGLVTYPLVTTVSVATTTAHTNVIERDKSTREVPRLAGESSWLPLVRGAQTGTVEGRLEDVTVRISCGVATGADAVFVVANAEITPHLARFAYPTIAGRNISGTRLPKSEQSMLVPYDKTGRLLPEKELGSLAAYLKAPARYRQLLSRSCAVRKPWYAFHETPPLADILRPKIICKDIGAQPIFVVDRSGSIVPRHSVYYIVPADPAMIDTLADYLNSDVAALWLRDHCQRAASGFMRLQSHVLRKLPLPPGFASLVSSTSVTGADKRRRTA